MSELNHIYSNFNGVSWNQTEKPQTIINFLRYNFWRRQTGCLGNTSTMWYLRTSRIDLFLEFALVNFTSSSFFLKFSLVFIITTIITTIYVTIFNFLIKLRFSTFLILYVNSSTLTFHFKCNKKRHTKNKQKIKMYPCLSWRIHRVRFRISGNFHEFACYLAKRLILF